MSQNSRRQHINRGLVTGAVLGAATFFLLLMVAGAFDAVDAVMGFSVVVALLSAVFGALIGYTASKFGASDEYHNVTISEMFGSLDERDEYADEHEEPEVHEHAYDYESDGWDSDGEHIVSYHEEPPALHTNTVAIPVMNLDDLAAATKIIEGHVLRTLTVLPPLPAAPPTIHHANVIRDEEVEAPKSGSTEPNLRDTLEGSDLRDVIGLLGNQGYIDALQYCLTSSEAGSQVVVLRAKGRVFGLGARGTKNEDGSTSFTRADVLKMMRKARLATSANVSD